MEEEHIKEVDVVSYVRQICEALFYLHERQIAHLDLKPENIICLSPNSRQVKIIDFGLARVLDASHVTRAIYGTRDYVAPEVLNFEQITLACDMWSLGVVTYMLLVYNILIIILKCFGVNVNVIFLQNFIADYRGLCHSVVIVGRSDQQILQWPITTTTNQLLRKYLI